MKTLVGIILLAVVGVTGCSGSGQDAAAPVVTETVTAPAEAESTKAGSESEEPAVLTEDSDAEDVIEALRASGLPISSISIFTKETDPNEQMGQPGAYSSKGAFVDRRVDSGEVKDPSDDSIDLGGGVEVFSDSRRAEGRARYIEQAIISTGGLVAAENDIVSGGILLRLSGYLSTSEVAEYRTTLEELTGERAVLVVKA